MGTYERISNHDRIWIDSKGNQVTPPDRQGRQGIIGSLRGVVEPPTYEEATKGRQSQNGEVQDVSLDEETKAALAVLKSKGLI